MAVAVAELGHPPGAYLKPRTELTPPQTLEDFIASIQHHNPQSLSPFGQNPDDLLFTAPQVYDFLLGLKRATHHGSLRPTFLNWEPTDIAMRKLAAFSGFEVRESSQVTPGSIDVVYGSPVSPGQEMDLLRKSRPLLVPHGKVVILAPSAQRIIPTNRSQEEEVYDFFEVNTILPIIYPGGQNSALLAVFRLLPFTYVHQ